MIVKRKSTSSNYRRGGTSHLSYSKYRYGGSGFFSNIIGRRLVQDNIKNLINSASKSKLGQKVADALVEGAKGAIKTQTQKGIEELATNALHKIKKKHRRSKEQDDIVNTAIQSLATVNIPTTSSIEGIIKRGRGIVYD